MTALAMRRRVMTATEATYNTYAGTTSLGDPWVLYVPTTAEGVVGTPLVQFFHAYGQNGDEILTAYPSLHSALMASGYAVAAGNLRSGTVDQWGSGVITGVSPSSVEALAAAVDTAVRTGRTWLSANNYFLSASMGALNALNTIRYGTLANIKGLYGLQPVTDLAHMYTGAHQGNIDAAYNIPTGGTYETQTAGRDPNLGAAADFAAVKAFRFTASAGDLVVYKHRTDAMLVTLRAITGLLEASEHLDTASGAHLASTQVVPGDVTAFLERCRLGDVVAPAVPTGLTLAAGAPASSAVQAKWAHSTDDVKAYKLYRNTGGADTLVATVGTNGDSTSWAFADGSWATGVTSISSATAAFTAADVGREIAGFGIPAGTTVSSVTNATTVVISAATTDNRPGATNQFVIRRTQHVDSGLTASTTYTYSVAAVDHYGNESAKSAGVNITTEAGGGMTVTKQTTLVEPTASDGPWSIAFDGGATAVAGRLLVAAVVIKNGTGIGVADVPTPTGWTLVGSEVGGFVAFAGLYYKIAAGGETGITVSSNAAGTELTCLGVIEVDGATATPFQANTMSAVNHGTGTFTSRTATAAALPAVANSMTVAVMGHGGATSAVTEPPSDSFVRLWQGGAFQAGVGIISAYKSLAAVPGAAPAVTETWTTAQRVATVIATFRGTGGPAVSDTFDRPNNASSMGSADTGQLWVPNSGTWGILNNFAYLDSVTAQATTVVDSGLADCTVTVTLAVMGAAGLGLCFRSTDDLNNFVVEHSTGAVYRRQAGAFTLLGNPGVAYVAGDVMAVVLAGSSIVLKRNGATILSVTDAFNVGATRHGLRSDSQTGSRFDNFEVSA